MTGAGKRTVGYRLIEDGRLAFMAEDGVMFDSSHPDAGMDAIAIAWDSDNGTILKHGLSERVRKWSDKARAAYAHSGFADVAKSIEVLRIPVEVFRLDPALVEALNCCIDNVTGMDGFKAKLGLSGTKKVPEPGPG